MEAARERDLVSDGHAVLGIADHSGWANFVVVAAWERQPRLADRRRVELLGPDLPRQPFHHDGEQVDLVLAAQVVDRVRESALSGARAAILALLESLAPTPIVAVTLRDDPAQPLPGTLAEILASHVAKHSADGILFRTALCEASRALGIEVVRYPRNAEMRWAQAALDASRQQVEELLMEFGRRVGPPWQKEQRLAAAAAIGLLAERTELLLPAVSRVQT